MDIVWVRDLVLIIFCVLGIVTLVALSIMSFITFRRLNSILDLTENTVKEIGTTTYFLSDAIAKPVIRVAGFISGVRRAIEAISGRKGERGG